MFATLSNRQKMSSSVLEPKPPTRARRSHSMVRSVQQQLQEQQQQQRNASNRLPNYSYNNHNINHSNNSVALPMQRSKYTERRAAAANAYNASTNNPNNPNKSLTGFLTRRETTVTFVERRKSHTAATSTAAPGSNGNTARTASPNTLALGQQKRIWNRSLSGRDGASTAASKYKAKRGEEHHGAQSPRRYTELAIQTNEAEINDFSLLIGDIKFMLPTKQVIQEIERSRDEAKKKELLKAQRKYEEHSERVGEHLTDLKEFLEKAVVTRRPRRQQRETIEFDHKLIHSMDELLKREVPKTESITDIKERIRNKEKELMHLFDNVDNVKL